MCRDSWRCFIGNNLNQISKRMNATGNVYAADIKQVKELMKKVWDPQKSMLSKLSLCNNAIVLQNIS